MVFRPACARADAASERVAANPSIPDAGDECERDIPEAAGGMCDAEKRSRGDDGGRLRRGIVPEARLDRVLNDAAKQRLLRHGRQNTILHSHTSVARDWGIQSTARARVSAAKAAPVAETTVAHEKSDRKT